MFGLLLAFTSAVSASEYEARPSATLKSLAEDSKSSRKLGGGLIMGLGALTTGVLLSNDSGNTEAFFAGGLIAGFGALPFFIESRPERAWNSVQNAANPEERENLAYSSLVDLADQSRYARLWGATFNIALAAYFLSQSEERIYNSNGYTEYDYTPSAIIHGVWGAYSLIVPSRTERAVKRFQSGASPRHIAQSGLTVGLAGHSGYQGLALRYNF